MENERKASETAGIAWSTIKRVAKASPDLTMAQFVAVWSEKIAEEQREKDRGRKSGKQVETAGIGTETAGKPRTYEEEERDLYAFARTVCGKNAGGFVTDLLKFHHRQIGEVRAVFERASKTADAKAFVAAACKRGKNGATTSLMDAFDRLDDRAGGAAFGDSVTLRDVTPGSD